MEKFIPLNLNQLFQMNGSLVIVVNTKGEVLTRGTIDVDREFVSGFDRTKYLFMSYGDTWAAFPYSSDTVM